jgi:hypothetical protein
MTMEAAFDGGAWRNRVLGISIPNSGVDMPIFALLLDRDGKRVKARIQCRSHETVPKGLW